MEPSQTQKRDYSDSQAKFIQEVRVNAEELAASFPESTRFDKPPSSLMPRSDAEYAHSSTETAFYPIENSQTLEPINDTVASIESRLNEERRIHQNMQSLANKKLRAEAPLQKQQHMEEYIEDLTAALHQRDEHIKQMNTTYRNLQRTYTNRLKDYDNRVAVLEKKNASKTTIIKVLCPIILIAAVLPIFFKSTDANKADVKFKQTTQTTQSTPNANGPQKYYYTVQPKDTLPGISLKLYGDSKYANQIKKENKLKDNKLKPFTKIIISEIELE